MAEGNQEIAGGNGALELNNETNVGFHVGNPELMDLKTARENMDSASAQKSIDALNKLTQSEIGALLVGGEAGKVVGLRSEAVLKGLTIQDIRNYNA